METEADWVGLTDGPTESEWKNRVCIIQTNRKSGSSHVVSESMLECIPALNSVFTINESLNSVCWLSQWSVSLLLSICDVELVVLIVHALCQPPKISIRKEEWEHRLREVQVTKQ